MLKKTLCWKASIEKTGPAKLRYQNENFIVAPSSSTAKDYYIQKIHVLKDLIRIQLERKKFLSEKRIFFHGNVFGKEFFQDFPIFLIPENILKFTLFQNILFHLNEKYSGLYYFINQLDI